jgi:hypothetical protein
MNRPTVYDYPLTVCSSEDFAVPDIRSDHVRHLDCRYPHPAVTTPDRITIMLRNLTILALLCVCAPAFAEPETEAVKPPDVLAESIVQSAVENLTVLQQSIDLKRSALRELQKKLKKTEDAAEKQEIEQQITYTRTDITNLQLSFDHIALGGVDTTHFIEQPEEQVDWRAELEQISKPLLSTLKQITAKPRQMDSLQREIGRYQDQLKEINRAIRSIQSIQSFSNQETPKVTLEPLNQLLGSWQQRKVDVQRALEVAQFKLNSLSNDTTSWHSEVGDAISKFVQGRGLTLLLAVIISLVVWFATQGLRWLYMRWASKKSRDSRITRAPLVLYGFRIAAGIAIMLSILMVFYSRGDILLLTLAVIAIAGIALSLRQTLPRYAAEIKLLLGIGPVRERERLVLDGVPYRVESLGVYTVLRNPALEGMLRLPLHKMNDYASRPASVDSWFPCDPGDYLLLASGSLGRVVRQTIELVELVVLDSVTLIRTGDFIGQGVRNLSREGFGIACTFGIDYTHQTICLDSVPDRFREAILTRFEREGMKADIKDIVVEFKTAGASSLDYLIYMVMQGRAAKSFFRAQRLVQQACVETCNQQGWIIPFTQITVHTAGD